MDIHENLRSVAEHIFLLEDKVKKLENMLQRKERLIVTLEKENFNLRAERDCANGSWK